MGVDVVWILLDREMCRRERGWHRNASDVRGSPGSGTHHDALPLRGHQDETLREDRVPRRFPGGPSERLPRADDPPLDVLRRLAERGRRS